MAKTVEMVPEKPPGMSTLTEFVKARLADDEREIRALWAMTEDPVRNSAVDVYRRRPQREVTAKRLLVEDHSGRHVCEDNMAGVVWDEKAEDIVEDPCRVLRIIGSVWADHPDYRPEWVLG